MSGVRIAHATLSNQLWVVENPKHRYTDGGYDCNICIGAHHYGKTTHLWLEPDGMCLVSTGVLEELKRAGMPQLTVVGHVDRPPPLRLGRDAERDQIDNTNRAIWLQSPALRRQYG